jgi:hypothetical protein
METVHLDGSTFIFDVTRLAKACYEKSLEEVLSLLPLANWDEEKSHPLHFAILAKKPVHERKEMITLLREAGAPLDGYSFFLTVTLESDLFEHLGEPVISSRKDVRYLDWALNEAARAKFSDRVKRLVAWGANPNAYDWTYDWNGCSDGNKVIHWVCLNRDIESLSAIAKVTDLEARNNCNETALDLLINPKARSADPEIVNQMKTMLELARSRNARNDIKFIAPWEELGRFGASV